MTDEPENLTLKLLRELRAEQAGMRAEQHALASLLGKVSDAVTAIAATQERHSEILGQDRRDPSKPGRSPQRDRRPACHHREAHRACEGMSNG